MTRHAMSDRRGPGGVTPARFSHARTRRNSLCRPPERCEGAVASPRRTHAMIAECAKLMMGAAGRGRWCDSGTPLLYANAACANHADRKAPHAWWQEHGAEKRRGTRAVSTGEVEARLSKAAVAERKHMCTP
jgi:hypothetical protein